MSKRLAGYAAILLAAFLFGMWATLGTFVLETVPPLTAAWFVQAISAIAFAPFLQRVRLSRKDWGLTAAAATFGAVLAPSLYFVGLSLTTPVNAALLSNTEALFTVVLAYAVLRERLRLGGYLAAAAILGGAVLVTLDLEAGKVNLATTLAGNLLLILAAGCWAADNTTSQIVTSRNDIPSYVCMKLSLGTLFLTPIVIAAGQPLTVAGADLPLTLFLALTGVALFTYLFYFAMRRIGALQVGAILSTSAAFGVAIAAAFGFRVTVIQGIGGAVMALGVVGMYRHAPAPRPTSSAPLAPGDGPPPPKG